MKIIKHIRPKNRSRLPSLLVAATVLALNTIPAWAQSTTFSSTDLKTGISNSLAVIMMFGFVLGISAVIYGGFAIRRGDVEQNMNAVTLNRLELLRRTLLGQLQTADANLRSGLHQHGMDAVVRAHLERALAHIREATVAVNEQAKIRSVQELADQLARIEQMQADLRGEQKPADESATSIHV